MLGGFGWLGLALVLLKGVLAEVLRMRTKEITLFVFFLIAMLVVLSGCADQKFSATAESKFNQCVEDRPEVKCATDCKDDGTCTKSYDYTIDAQTQISEILFVNDNSGSMYPEQVEMGKRFPSLLEKLSTVDYRIAVTTTDIRKNNLPYTNGKLLQFQNGKSYLDGSLSASTEQSYFQKVIQREETKVCDENGYAVEHCPSGDERGIYAAALVLDKNPDNFIRPTGHLAIVVLSDEDESSTGDAEDLVAIEQPENFVDFFKEKYPNKSMKFHSVIIRPANKPGGTACYNQQRADPTVPPGYHGDIYAELTALTGGVLGNICSYPYTNQVAAIGDSIAQVREPLPCKPVGDLKVTYIPEPTTKVTYQINAAQNEVVFSDNFPKNTKIRFQFKCADK